MPTCECPVQGQLLKGSHDYGDIRERPANLRRESRISLTLNPGYLLNPGDLRLPHLQRTNHGKATPSDTNLPCLTKYEPSASRWNTKRIFPACFSKETST